MRKFGEIVVDEGYATEEQIETALKYQKTSDILVGKILVDMHTITHADSDRVGDHLRTPQGQGKKFGAVAVELGLCTDADVQKALEFQRTSKGLLGDLLIALGTITQEQRDAILKLQMEEMRYA
jgi:hypothetical protein